MVYLLLKNLVPVAFTMKARAEGMRDFGPCLSPQNAWNVMQGIETLSVRMEKHCANAEKMVEYLLAHESVAWVSHPSAPDHPDYELAKKILPKGRGSMIAFWN
jgi:O-acetylhomoserine (thiol)-lyase